VRRALASAMVVIAALAWALAHAACSDTTPAPSGDLPGDRGSLDGPRDAGADARESKADGDADAEADVDADALDGS